MFKYIIKRLSFFIPTLILISFITFGLSKITPGDPVLLALGNRDSGSEAGESQEKLANEKAYFDKAESLGFHLPTFYFSIQSMAMPDTMHKFVRRNENELLTDLVSQYGNWELVLNYFQNIRSIDFALLDIPSDTSVFENVKNIRQKMSLLYINSNDDDISAIISEMLANSKNKPTLHKLYTKIQDLDLSYKKVKNQTSTWKRFIPTINWHGTNNQYHRWLCGDAPWFFGDRQPGQVKGFLRGDFGISYLDGRPIASKLSDALPWTLIMSILSLLFSYLLAIPIGVFNAINKGSKVDRISTVFLFMLNSLPVFWIATLLVTFITTDEYGMNWFPTFGLGEVDDSMGFFERFAIRSYHLILPVFCLTYGGLAYLSRQMRAGMLSTLGQDYIRTARAKGSTENIVVWKHAFKNSLIPIITIISAIFPALIAGSFIVEWIFSIPGMGKLSFEALMARDFPMVFTVIMLAGVLTLIGNLVADILYAAVDPRISYDK